LLLLGATMPLPALGQTPEAKAQAETLFEEGVRKLDAKEYAPACKAFEASNRLDPGLGTLLYLADCYEKLGKTASAWAAFREAASLAKASGQTEREAVAQRRAASLSPRLSRITMVVPPEADHPGLLVLRNGVPVPREIWGMPMPVDPGKHEYEISAPGKKASRIEIELKPTEDARELKLSPLEDTTAPPPAPPSSSSAPAPTPAPVPAVPEPSPRGAQRTAGLIVAGVGLLGTGLGAYLALRARTQSEDADALCRPEDRTRCGVEGARLGNDARSSANLATAAFSLGASALLGGALLYLLAPSPTTTGRPRLLPALGPAHAGLSLGGAW
jgi:tetratricopeptide (TPR) repeat protein